MRYLRLQLENEKKVYNTSTEREESLIFRVDIDFIDREKEGIFDAGFEGYCDGRGKLDEIKSAFKGFGIGKVTASHFLLTFPNNIAKICHAAGGKRIEEMAVERREPSKVPKFNR